MPTYMVTSLEKRLNAKQKEKIAAAITRIHNEVTGAPAYFAQVIFNEVKPGNYFMGGAPLAHEQVFVLGQIRGGRTPESKDKLIAEMVSAIADITRLQRTGIWIYIVDLLARQMVEFGHVLPEPGDEQKWTAALPEADRKMMQAIGGNR